jgi:ABC-type transport system involved in cytochrome c biogenesis permease subunit
MDPEITNLVPVLRSYWLVIHVAVITTSYGFLALAALLAFISLLFMIFQTAKNDSFTQITIEELTAVIEMSLIIGLYMLTIGTFLGGIWANESWGRYWGWDSKQTWAFGYNFMVRPVLTFAHAITRLFGSFNLYYSGLLSLHQF